MKKIILVITTIGFILSLHSCFLTLDANGIFSNSTINNYVTNINGNVVTYNRTITPYTDFEIEGPFDIQIDSSLREDEIRLECNENLANYIKTNVSGETLSIKAKDNIHFQNMTKLKVFVPK